MNKFIFSLTTAAILISITACALKSNTAEDRLHPNCSLLSREDNIIYCDGQPYQEVFFLKRPNDETIIGISVYDFKNKKEQWIYPSQGWKLNGNCCVTLANYDAMPISQISAVWHGTVSASYPLSGGCTDVRFTDDNSRLLFTTQTLAMSNSVWEYSFTTGRTQKIGKVSKKR